MMRHIFCRFIAILCVFPLLVSCSSSPEPKKKETLTPEQKQVKVYIQKLKEGTEAEQVTAAKKLAQMGEDARPAVESLKVSLQKNKRPALQIAAATTLVALGMPDLALPIAVQFLKENPEYKEQALDTLSKMGKKAHPAVPTLIGALADESMSVREKAVDVLAAMGTPAAVQLSEALESPKVAVKKGALQALGKMGKDGQGALPEMIVVLVEADGDVETAAREALKQVAPQMKEETLNQLYKLEDKRKKVREKALDKLRELAAKDPVAVAALIQGLNSSSEEVRRGAARTLGKVGPLAKQAEKYLSRMVARDGSSQGVDRVAGYFALAQITGNESYRGKLEESLRQGSKQARREAAELLGYLSGNRLGDVVKSLVAALQQDRDLQVKYRAVKSLGRLAPKVQAAWDELKKLAQSRSVILRGAAKKALEKIEKMKK